MYTLPKLRYMLAPDQSSRQISDSLTREMQSLRSREMRGVLVLVARLHQLPSRAGLMASRGSIFKRGESGIAQKKSHVHARNSSARNLGPEMAAPIIRFGSWQNGFSADFHF